ncbi:MAG: DNA methylase, partial [Clostridia bacterium]|nr:DNA methylase [Clostridia bacterium]
NLVVADGSRTEKTICLAVSPSLKQYGIPGRARLFEVVQRVKAVNDERRRRARPTGSSTDARVLASDPSLAVDYIVAPPRMAHYMDYSTRIYQIYLRHVAPEDIHVYSIDEVMIDITPYLRLRGCTPYAFASMLIKDVLRETGITATAGIGTNLYLCKIAMDIVAKRVEADRDGVRIAELDEMKYRELLWDHRPLTDFWRVGRGYARTLEKHGLYTMGDVARCSVGNARDYYNEELLYRLFGVNAELLIDHAWGYEPCTIADIKAYKPEASSICSGQVLQAPYTAARARLVVREMADQLALELVEKGLVTDQLVLTVGYDVGNLTDPAIRAQYHGPIVTDPYGRKLPKHAHGTENLGAHTSSAKRLTQAVASLYDRIVDPCLLVRRMNLTVNRVIAEDEVKAAPPVCEQISLFSDHEAEERAERERREASEKEKRMQKAMLAIKQKYGKNAILKGMNLEEDATARDRNGRIGGHKA